MTTLMLLMALSTHDLNADRRIDGADLSALLATWGPGAGKPADFNADGRVDGADLARLLTHYGVREFHHAGGGCDFTITLPAQRYLRRPDSPFGAGFERFSIALPDGSAAFIDVEVAP